MQFSLFTICALVCAFAITCNAEKKSKKKQLWGVNHSGTEYTCVQYDGIFDGQVDNKAIETMLTWNINIVRVPLNEDCWLGINGHKAENSGMNYKRAVADYVKRLRSYNLTVIVDLHWTDGYYDGPGVGTCKDYAAICQKPMPDKKNAPRFWKSVAKAFKNDYGVIFELFNEPFPDQPGKDETANWKCLRDGGNCTGINFETAGMQDLVNAVRSTGATNRILLPGLDWNNDMSRWLEFLPKDPANNMMASWHSYNINTCNNEKCWNKHIAPIAERFPIFVTEIGQYDCKHDYVEKLMKWLDSKNINYLAWTWNNWDCASGPSLISDYDGTPTEFGKGVRKYFLSKTYTKSFLSVVKEHFKKVKNAMF